MSFFFFFGGILHIISSESSNSLTNLVLYTDGRAEVGRMTRTASDSLLRVHAVEALEEEEEEEEELVRTRMQTQMRTRMQM